MGHVLIARSDASARAIVVALVSAVVAGCASGTDPARTAESITRAVYANDLDATIATFDAETKKSVSRSDVGALSDKMHALGTLDTLTPRSADADAGRYAYDARFTGGTMLVEMRLDASGRVGAYRVTPEASAMPRSK